MVLTNKVPAMYDTIWWHNRGKLMVSVVPDMGQAEQNNKSWDSKHWDRPLLIPAWELKKQPGKGWSSAR